MGAQGSSIHTSDVHAQLNRDNIISDTCWCYHLYCTGVGVNMENLLDPLFAGDGKQLCIRGGSSWTWDIMGTDTTYDDGLCSGLTVCLCMTEHMQIPPLKGAPKCVCVNKEIAKGDGSTNKSMGDLPYKDVLGVDGKTWWLYYCLCMGLGFQIPGKDGLPLYAAESKQICVRGSARLEDFSNDGLFCASMGTECCIWSQCEMPPKKSAFFACCGKKDAPCKFGK
mmetsp:Transcript_48314/g.136543  ORF Transcript_48314/g.136543 Transcript_48314/m.136543 type:complete len:224 (+) Transcript_48314:108-779(+)